MYQEDILYPGDVQALPEYKVQPDLPTYIQETTKVPETNESKRMKSFWDAFLKMTNIRILNDKKMRVVCLVSIKVESELLISRWFFFDLILGRDTFVR